jgi:hypothetical protein
MGAMTESGSGGGRARRGSRRTCPRCGSPRSVRIVYGYPAPELLEQARGGGVSLGGCVLTGDDPTRQCRACAHRWSPERD